MARITTATQVAPFRRRVVAEALRTGNISHTARQYTINRQTLHLRIRRFDGSLDSLNDKSSRQAHPSAAQAIPV